MRSGAGRDRRARGGRQQQELPPLPCHQPESAQRSAVTPLNCSAPAARVQGLSFSVCFRSVASFYHPQYLSRTSPLSIHSAWNSWIWHFYLNNTLLPWRNLWNLVLTTLRPDWGNWLQQFRRFLATTFRLVGNFQGNFIVSFEREFLLKTDSGYPRDVEVTFFTLANPESSLRFKTQWASPSVSALARSLSLYCGLDS